MVAVASTNGKDPVTGKMISPRLLLSTRSIASVLMIGLITIITVPTFVRHASTFIFQPLSISTSTTETNEVSSSRHSTSSLVAVEEEGMIKFGGFNDELIPPNTVVDINIGTNMSPMKERNGRYRILVDPLFAVCDNNAKLTEGVTAFCMAVANYTGFATFNEYNPREGTGRSSSLAHVQPGTSHERFEVLSKRTVLVMEAAVLLSAIASKNTTVHRLKLDMQGFELTVLKNLQTLLSGDDSNLVIHVMAECFYPDENGLQIYTIDNSCEKIAALLTDAGYVTKDRGSSSKEYSDVVAYKKGMATDFESKW